MMMFSTGLQHYITRMTSHTYYNYHHPCIFGNKYGEPVLRFLSSTHPTSRHYGVLHKHYIALRLGARDITNQQGNKYKISNLVFSVSFGFFLALQKFDILGKYGICFKYPFGKWAWFRIWGLGSVGRI